MSVTIDITYLGDLHCRAVHGPSGHSLVTDAPVDNGGRGEEFSPTDLVATGLGACLLTVVGLLARREGLALEGTKVRVVKTMAAARPRRIAALEVEVTLPSTCKLTPAQRSKLEAVAHLCPVKQSLHPETKVDISFVTASS
jgi:putative redox protein